MFIKWINQYLCPCFYLQNVLQITFCIPAATTLVSANIILHVGGYKSLLAALLASTFSSAAILWLSSWWLGVFLTADWLLSLVCLKPFSSSLKCALQPFPQGLPNGRGEGGPKGTTSSNPSQAKCPRNSYLSYNPAQILHSTPLVTSILDYSPLIGTSATGRRFLFILWFWDMGHTRISVSWETQWRMKVR